MWLYSLQFFNTIIPLVTIPYITRILGASQYGVFSIQLNIVAYLQVVVEYGFALSATRKVTLMKENNDLSGLFSRVTYSRGGLFLLVFMCTIAYTSISQQTPEENYCLMVLAISLIAYCFQQNWIFQGKQDMRFISITNIIARTVTTVLIFVFVKTSSDLIIYCILYSIAPLIANIIGTMVAIKKYSIKLVMVKIPELWIELKDGFYVFTTQLSSKVFSSIGITFLGFFASESLVGVYSALYKIPYVLLMLWSPISQVMYPIMSRKITEKFSDGIVFIRKIKYITLIIFGMCAFLISLCSHTIVMIFFGKEYMEFWYIVIPLLLWVLIGINNNIADGTDISWLWDTDFSRLKDAKGLLVTSGIKAKDMAKRLVDAGVTEDKIVIEEDISKAVELVANPADKDAKVTILPSYTVLMKLSRMKF